MTRERRAGVWRDAREAGFTLVELLVTLTVIGVGIFGTVRVFHGSLDATASADARTHAQAIASREVEGLLALPYDDLGFTSSQSGFRSTFEGDPTVQIAVPRTSPLGADEVHDGITYSIRRDIVWADATDGTTNAFKRVVATITWVDDAGTHEVRSDAGVYELGILSAGTTTSTTIALLPPNAPSGLTATLSLLNPTHEIDLDWNPGAVLPTRWEIERSSDEGATWVTITSTQPAETSSYSVTGLAASTTYQFRVRGANSIGTSSWSNTAEATTAAAPSCSVLTASATVQGIGGSTVRKKATGNTLQNDVHLEVNAETTCTALTARVETTPGTAYTVNMTKDDSVFTYTIWKSAWNTWSTGNKSIQIKDSAGNVVATISLTVTT